MATGLRFLKADLVQRHILGILTKAIVWSASRQNSPGREHAILSPSNGQCEPFNDANLFQEVV